ncbi:MAG: hypothetical protein AAF926_02250 [Pseudomonadota bacterium]
MSADKEGKVACRTPAEGRDGVTHIPSWKFDCVRDAIRQMVGEAGSEGLRFSDLRDAVANRLGHDQRATLGSLGWHVTTVKLELEVRGEIARLPGTPQRLVLND